MHFQRTAATEEVEDLRKKLQISRLELQTALKALEDAARSQTAMFRPPLHTTSRQNDNRVDALQTISASSTPLKDAPLASRPLKRKAPVADAESIKTKDPRLQAGIHLSASESQSIQLQPRVAVTSIEQCIEFMGKVPLPLDHPNISFNISEDQRLGSICNSNEKESKAFLQTAIHVSRKRVTMAFFDRQHWLNARVSSWDHVYTHDAAQSGNRDLE
ncbi:hypothetical protein DFH06DRAFT_512189 [Mycena polygramma]|nr:hypothetical protein DFH06DRAFT_512189 [Mycena polygramma]